MKDYEVYAQNSGGTAGKHNYKSVNQAAEADARDELRKYIAGITQAAVTQEEQAANIHDSNKAATDAMFAQIKVMTDQIAQLTKAMANNQQGEQAKQRRQRLQQQQQRRQRQRRWRWRRWPTRQGKRTCTGPIHQAAKHGLLLFLTWFPSSRRKSHKRHVQQEAHKSQCDGNMERQERRQRILATAHPRQH